MVYFCKRDKTGKIVSGGWSASLTAETLPEGLEELTREAYEAWLAAQAAAAPEEPEDAAPTAMERLRADVDYLAALQGVTL